jgi:predicted enzyme related to lactoylglutathione lyase
MAAVTEIAFTSYPVTDMARARAFYEGHFGLEASSVIDTPSGWSFTEYVIGEGAFSLARMDGWTPTDQGPSMAFEMADFPAAIAELKNAGVRFITEPFETAVCHMAVILDPDGNKLTIHKRKPGHT